MIGKRLTLNTLLFTAILTAKALALSVTASVDSDEVELGDAINLSITVGGRGGSLPDPILPDLSDFDVYSSGRNHSISIVNGAFSSSLEMNYTLMPKKVGNLIIGPVVVKDKKEMVASDPIKITVKKPGSLQKKPQAERRSTGRKDQKQRENFFIRQIVDKTSPYVGQQVTLTFRFYQAVNLWGQPSLEWPEYVGFTVEDLPPNSRSYQNVNGKRYLVTEIRRALFPITPGEVTVETPRLTIKLEDLGSMMDPFSLFDRGSFRKGKPRVLTARPITLNVRTLPQKKKPADFSGAVGSYRIRADVDKDSVGVDEPITLKVTLSGTGNIKSLPPVEMPELSDFRVYESGNTISINNKGRLVSGSKTFEQAIIPRTSGIFTIPSLEYSFFDPNQGAYKAISTRPIQITATGEGLVDVGGAPKNIIDGSMRSFAYIITEFPEPANNIDLSGHLWFWFLQGIPILGVIAAVAVRSHYKKVLGDRSYARRMTAAKRSKSVFKSAVAKKRSGDFPGFCADLYDAVTGFIADRLDLEKSGLTIDDLRTSENISADIKDDMTRFLENCQTARFAPSSCDTKAADDLLEEASNLIKQLEKAI
jgi:hypothetical protein